MTKVAQTLRERFEAKYVPEPNTGYWLWTASQDDDGYGKIGRGSRRDGKELAHRVSWLLHRGPIPSETPCVLHTCDTPQCVNPDHLWLGTKADNVRDMDAKGRRGYGNGWPTRRLNRRESAGRS